MGSAKGAVAKAAYNNAFKVTSAVLGQAFEGAKAHSFTKPSLAKVQERLECGTLCAMAISGQGFEALIKGYCSKLYRTLVYPL